MSPSDDAPETSTRGIAGASANASTRDAASFAGGAAGRRHTLAGADASGLYALLVESVRDFATFALDPDGYILSWNRGAELINGYRADEIIGRHFSTFYSGEDIAAGKPAWELEVAARDGRLEDEAGGTVHLRCRCTIGSINAS